MTHGPINVFLPVVALALVVVGLIFFLRRDKMTKVAVTALRVVLVALGVVTVVFAVIDYFSA